MTSVIVEEEKSTMTPSVRHSASPSRQSRGRLRLRRSIGGLIGTVPALVWYLVFLLGPLIGLFWMSLYDQPGILADSTFVGINNFSHVLGDPTFRIALINTVLQVTFLVPVLMIASLLLAYYLHREPRGYGVLSVVLFLPALLSLAGRSMAFVAILAPKPFGLLNGVLEALHLGFLERAWLADDKTALLSIIAVELWGGIGFTAILLNARMASIPLEVEESATLDGIGQLGMLRQIIYPMLRDYFGMVAALQLIWTLFTSAGDVLLLTGGGPGYASTNLAYLVYNKAFLQQDLGYATAVGVLLFVAGLIGALALRAVFRAKY